VTAACTSANAFLGFFRTLVRDEVIQVHGHSLFLLGPGLLADRDEVRNLGDHSTIGGRVLQFYGLVEPAEAHRL
jgi:hypothetical protein